MDNQELYDKIMSSLGGKVDTANSNIQILMTNQNSMLSRLSKIEERMAKLENKVNELNGAVHA